MCLQQLHRENLAALSDHCIKALSSQAMDPARILSSWQYACPLTDETASPSNCTGGTSVSLLHCTVMITLHSATSALSSVRFACPATDVRSASSSCTGGTLLPCHATAPNDCHLCLNRHAESTHASAKTLCALIPSRLLPHDSQYQVPKCPSVAPAQAKC